jgi:hypothetical protein
MGRVIYELNHTALIRSWRERIKQSEIQDLVVWRVERINNRAASTCGENKQSGIRCGEREETERD